MYIADWMSSKEEETVHHSKILPRGVGWDQTLPSGFPSEDKLDSSAVGYDLGYSLDKNHVSTPS